jgi:NAD(P)-dependent dehydrogenase (short-subunit alcohol dehydrogenase family)
LVRPGEDNLRHAEHGYGTDLSSPEAVRRLHQQLCEGQADRVGGIINCLGLSPLFRTTAGEDGEAEASVAEWTFNIVKEFLDDLQSSANAGGGWFINVTALGGQFGLGSEVPPALAAAGTLGITKTLRREHPRLHVKNIDVDPHLPADMLAARLIQELDVDDDLAEVGLTQGGRWRPALAPSPAAHTSTRLSLENGPVILVTGGAYGITAEIAHSLAARIKPRLIVVGRSPRPEPESHRTYLLDRAGLRQFFLEGARAGGERILPAGIEQSVNRILKERQIRGNLDSFAAAGAEVEYHALDVRDSRQFGGLIDGLYERFGRIDGVIHGAGIIEDKRIADKTLPSFARVFRTKVQSALTLARKLRPETLRFLVFFGSVSGRFGNVGQVDYSAANEVLNKLADRLHRAWPARVVCINWGPWDGGMVSDGLRRLYSAAGVELMSAEEGVASFLAEIDRTDRPNGEVVIARGIGRIPGGGLT